MIGPTFTAAAGATLTLHASRIDACLAKLTPEQVWSRGSEEENAIGNLVLHLCGNLRQYTRHAILGEADVRTRDEEFNAQHGEGLRERLQAIVADAATIIGGVSDQRLMEKVVVQNREMTVLEAIFKTTEHFSLHAGQILFATKQLTREALGFTTHNRARA
jgi:uncharacterized damage-inducible protein DinB